MQYFSIIISVFVVLVVLIILNKTVWPVIQQKRLNKTLMRSGSDAEGIVLQVNQTGIYINNLPQLAIQLQVVPVKGHNFVTELREILSVTELPMVQPGRKLKVKFNPHNHKQVIILRDL